MITSKVQEQERLNKIVQAFESCSKHGGAIAFDAYGTFVEAQLALDVEAQRRSWPDYAGD